MASVLITRPLEFALPLAAEIERQGHSVICDPILKITPTGAKRPLQASRAELVLLTSRTTLSHLNKTQLAELLEHPCYCVGDETARAARLFGFTDVRSGASDGAGLACMVCAQWPRATLALHIGGTDLSQEPAHKLRQAGWEVIHWPVYKAELSESLSVSTIHGLQKGKLDAILFFSSRTARGFVSLVKGSPLESCCERLTAVGLSEAVVRVLVPLPFQEVLTAPQATQESLLRTFLSRYQESNMTNIIDQEPNKDDKDTGEEDMAPNGSSNKPRLNLWAVVMALLVVVAILLAQPMGFVGSNLGNRQPDEEALGNRVAALEARLKKTEERLESATSAPVMPTPAGGDVPAPLGEAQEIEALKSGLAGLSGALSLLQGELEKSSRLTNEDRLNTQAGLATLLAFMQMQRIALNGETFEGQRQILRKLADNDQILIDMLMKLEKHALTGAPTHPKLYREWQKASAEAQAELRKVGAQTWMDRLLVAIEGLVSVRSLTPKAGDSLSFASVSLDLEDGKLAEALRKVEGLPPAVQDKLELWKQKAQARMEVDKLMDEMILHLIDRGAPSAPVAAPSPPPVEQAPVTQQVTP